MLRRRVDRTTRDLEWKCTKAKDQADLCMKKAICQHDIERLQDFYWRKYRVKLSKKEAEKILIVQMRERGRHDFAHAAPPPKGQRPIRPQGPQRPPRR